MLLRQMMQLTRNCRIKREHPPVGIATLFDAKFVDDRADFAVRMLRFILACGKQEPGLRRDLPHRHAFAGLSVGFLDAGFQNDRREVTPGFLTCVVFVPFQYLTQLALQFLAAR